MPRKINFLTAIAFSAAVLGVAFSASAAQAKPILIKFSHVVAENTPKGQMANFMKKLVDERLGGKVRMEVYPSSQLYGDNKVLEAILLGDVQMAAPANSKFSKYTKVLQLFDLPFLFKDFDAVMRFTKTPEGISMLKSMEGKGITALGYVANGMKQISAHKPIRVPADAAGLKFRIMSSDVLAAQFEAVKALPLKKPFSEVFTLLNTKAIDGQENSWSNIFSKKFFEVQEYITESDHGVLNYTLVTSTEFWKSLPADIRAEMEKIVEESLVFAAKVAAEKAKADRQKIIDSGRSKVIQLTAGERAQWVAVMKPVWKKFEDQIGKDLIAAAVASNK